MAALVRMFCMVGPRRPTEHVTDAWWPDISYTYVCALADAGINVRVIAIGGAQFQAWEHWRGLAPLFAGEIVDNFVNIVCCPPGIVTGQRMTAQSMAPRQVLAGDGGMVAPPHITAAGAAADDDVVYEPATALAQYYTEGHRNIAITGTYPSPPSDAELEALAKYDAVLTPTAIEADLLARVSACAYPASRLKKEAKSLPILNPR